MHPRPTRADRFLRRAALSLLAFLAVSPDNVADVALSFEERVAVQAAIERVYYTHQVGAHQPFGLAVPEATLEAKVRGYLEQSAALEAFWHTSVTAEMLQAELDRIASGTRFPARLLEVYQALGNDPILVQECLARPALVHRLARGFFAYDRRWHGEARAEADALRERLASGDIDLHAEGPHRAVLTMRRATVAGEERSAAAAIEVLEGHDAPAFALPEEEFGRMRARAPERIGEVGPVAEERTAFVIRIIDDAECLAHRETRTVISGALLDENPAPGEVFVYLAEYIMGTTSGYGVTSAGRELIIGSGNSCH